jgi:hypothetical protein
MQASIVDLRYKMNEVLSALKRKESITITYYGDIIGEIIPKQSSKKKKQRIQDHPFFGMYKGEESSVEDQMKKLRGGRYRDI